MKLGRRARARGHCKGGVTMPHYDYQCDGCGLKFEQFQFIKAAPLKACPKCGKDTLRRLIGSGGAVIFKGPGWATNSRLDHEKKYVVSPNRGAKNGEA